MVWHTEHIIKDAEACARFDKQHDKERDEVENRLRLLRFPKELGNIKKAMSNEAGHAIDLKDLSDGCAAKIKAELEEVIDRRYFKNEIGQQPSANTPDAMARLLTKGIITLLLLRPEFFVTSEATKKKILDQWITQVAVDPITTWEELLDRELSLVFRKHNTQPTTAEVAELVKSFDAKKTLVDTVIDTLPWHIKKIDQYMELIQEFNKDFYGVASEFLDHLRRSADVVSNFRVLPFEEVYDVAEYCLERALRDRNKSIPAYKEKFKAILNTYDKFGFWLEFSSTAWAETAVSFENLRDTKAAFQELIEVHEKMGKVFNWAIYVKEVFELLDVRESQKTESGWIY